MEQAKQYNGSSPNSTHFPFFFPCKRRASNINSINKPKPEVNSAWKQTWATPEAKRELAHLQIEYELLLQLPCSLILVDRVDKSLWQWFPKYDKNKLQVKFQPCTHGNVWVWLMILPSFLTLKFHPFFCPSEHSWMTRPHFSCTFCRIRKVVVGLLPRKFALERYQIFTIKKRQHKRFKAFLLRKFGVLTESVAV